MEVEWGKRKLAEGETEGTGVSPYKRCACEFFLYFTDTNVAATGFRRKNGGVRTTTMTVVAAVAANDTNKDANLRGQQLQLRLPPTQAYTYARTVVSD